jgi:hypothetical protein
MYFDLTEVTLSPLKLIMKLTEAQKLYEIYINDDFTVSIFIPASD